MSDQLFRDVPLPHTIELPILGVPTGFHLSDARLLEVIDETFGAWRSVEGHPELLAESHASVRLWMHPAPGSVNEGRHIAYRMPSAEQLLVVGQGSVGSANSRTRASVGYVAEELLRDRAYFSEAFLEPLTYVLVAGDQRVPFHAAAVARGDAALLLFGTSGSGKSTLTWACAQRGLGVLSEDVVYLQVDPVTRVWGFPGPLHVPTTSARFFPDLDGHPTMVVGGREKHVIRAASPVLPPVATKVQVCLLEPGGTESSLESINAAEVLDGVGMPTEPGFDRFTESLGPVLETIVGEAGWRLKLGQDPHTAAALIEDALMRLEGC